MYSFIHGWKTTIRWDISSAVVLLACAGCQIVGGGIAGAGYDAIWSVNAAKRFEPVVSPLIEERKIEHERRDDVEWHNDDLMRTFPHSVAEVDEDAIDIPGTALTARYRRERFDLYDGEVRLLTRKLPSVFYMHGPRVGVGQVGGLDVVMIVVTSRATTGLVFVGLYTLFGEVLYEDVLCVCEVCDIRAADSTIEILSSTRTRQLRVIGSGPAPPST